MTTSSLISSPEAPAIVCPRWCAVPREQHLGELDLLDAWVVHWSDERLAGKGCNVRLASTTRADGTPDPNEPTHLFIEDAHFHDGATLGAAQQFAEGILAGVREARTSESASIVPGSADGCPSWCNFDHDGPIVMNPGEHANTLSDNGIDMVMIDSASGGPARVSLWFSGNDHYDFPLNDASAGVLRAMSKVLGDAATALEQVRL